MSTTESGAGAAETCAICGGMGFVTRAVPVGHPDFGKAFPCVCQQDALLERQQARSRALSNLDVVADKTFDTFLLELPGLNDEQRSVLAVSFDQARSYAQNPDGWLLFQGNYGSGKTHLAVAIANFRLALDERVLFITAPDLLDHLRSTFAPGAELDYDALFERVRTFPLLVLDDLGAESPTEWAQEKLYQLINHRYMHRLATVFTTNVDLTRIEARIRSRLTDRNLTQIVNMPLPDFRRGDAGSTPHKLADMTLYQDMTFDTFDPRDNLPADERRNLQKIYEVALGYARNPEGWLVFIGEHGSGKTHLAASVANYRLTLGEKVFMVSAPDLLDYLRAAFAPHAETTFTERFYEIRSAPLLVIDHLDLHNASSWALEKMRQIVDHRYLAKLPTIFTTNQSLEELDPLVRSRLMDARRCHVLGLLAPDYRGGDMPATRRR
ncbi:MAG: ATP-binding protein [Chloroflexi bacterium]|nr:ATP-binding protein [Chloroflexota bacterium]